MKKNKLGKTDIEVSELCFGTLTLGPLQKKLSQQESLKILAKALDKGINFFDTADMYNTYTLLKPLLKMAPEIVICSRSYDYTASGVKRSVERALKELNRDYIDLFLLHEQESKNTFRGHWEAIEELLKFKEKGIIRATGFSTHRVEAVRDSLDYPELEIIFPLINKNGLGIEDGTSFEMLEAINSAKNKNKGIFTMKPLGGGNLIKDRIECLEFQKDLLNKNIISSVAIGMGSIDEVIFNTSFFNNEPISQEIAEKTLNYPRKLHIDDWCEKCGRCINRCHQNALSFKNDHIEIDHSKCLRCGYCSAKCPVFAIKVV